MSDKFQFSQGNDGTVQFARMTVPGCGRKEKDEAPIIQVEIEHDGKITLLVYADILSSEPTHEIPLNGANIELKQKEANTEKGDPVRCHAGRIVWPENL